MTSSRNYFLLIQKARLKKYSWRAFIVSVLLLYSKHTVWFLSEIIKKVLINVGTAILDHTKGLNSTMYLIALIPDAQKCNQLHDVHSWSNLLRKVSPYQLVLAYTLKHKGFISYKTIHFVLSNVAVDVLIIHTNLNTRRIFVVGMNLFWHMRLYIKKRFFRFHKAFALERTTTANCVPSEKLSGSAESHSQNLTNGLFLWKNC